MRRREFLLGTATALGAGGSRLSVPLGGTEFTSFYWGEEWDKPFLHPIRSASGRVLSRGFPVEPREGDSTDHGWHRGIWWGHGIVNGVDLWREQGRDKTGRLVVQAAPVLKGSLLTATMAMVSPQGKTFGSIRQSFEFSTRDRLRIIDATIEIAASVGEALTFGDTDDGGFGFRLSEEFREDRGARLRNSEGLEGSKAIWGKPARWVDYSARLGGVDTGVAVFDHPANFRHPTRWHARGYSLCSANPFALKSFTRAGDGSHTVEAGQRLSLRYRVVIHEGAWEPEPG